MRRRLYFVLPDVATAQTVHNELLLSRIEERHMHFLASDDLDLRDLPAAGLLQKTDVVHGTQMGFTIGGATGIVMGILTTMFFFAEYNVSGLVVLWMAAAGAIIGAWSSSMIAVNVPNTRLKAFKEDIDAGHVLLMVDVQASRAEEISALIRKHHPEADIHGVEPTIPAFP
ncbi:MAG TPA: DUF1269 domain-containing protein [Gammaproteobacteria bacterium]|nr:DUF1269 domain-containing protein [Gammaproteobacteria bacterium]